MRRIWVGALIFVLLFIVLGFATFKFGLGHFVAKTYESVKDKNYFHELQLLSIFIGGLVAISCSIVGYYIAKKRRRNRIIWTILCFFFNFWAFIILLFLPASTIIDNKDKEGPRGGCR